MMNFIDINAKFVSSARLAVGLPPTSRDAKSTEGSQPWSDFVRTPESNTAKATGARTVTGGNSVMLPWPSSVLSPNSRTHWSKKSRAAKQYRGDCWALTMASKLRIDHDGPIPLTITFLPPDHRGRDWDNMIASFKSGLDGLADALKVNDKRFVLQLAVGDPVKLGAVKVTL